MMLMVMRDHVLVGFLASFSTAPESELVYLLLHFLLHVVVAAGWMKESFVL